MQEQFSYSLMASALGILIVFSILVLLSGVMILIKRLSDDRPEKKSAKSTPAPAASEPAAQIPSQPALPLPVLVAAAAEGASMANTGVDWLIAAVAAFFASEDEGSGPSGQPSASAWASTYVSYDPWVANNKLSN